MKKILKGICYICLFVFTLIFLANCATLFKTRNWYRTTATITAIHTPVGIVEGEYEDDKGEIHREERIEQNPRYVNIRAFGPISDPKEHIGDTLRIIYDPESGAIKNYDRLINSAAVSIVIAAASLGGLLWISKSNKKAETENK